MRGGYGWINKEILQPGQGYDVRFSESMDVAYGRGYKLSEQAHRGLSIGSRADIAEAELSDVGVDTVLSRSFSATLPPPWEVLEEYQDDDQTAFFAGWLDGAAGSTLYRESVEASEQLSMTL